MRFREHAAADLWVGVEGVRRREGEREEKGADGGEEWKNSSAQGHLCAREAKETAGKRGGEKEVEETT